MPEKQGELLPKDVRLLNAIIKKYDGKKEFLICILQDIQNRYEYLSRNALIHVSKKLDIPLIQLYLKTQYYLLLIQIQTSGVLQKKNQTSPSFHRFENSYYT